MITTMIIIIILRETCGHHKSTKEDFWKIFKLALKILFLGLIVNSEHPPPYSSLLDCVFLRYEIENRLRAVYPSLDTFQKIILLKKRLEATGFP